MDSIEGHTPTPDEKLSAFRDALNEIIRREDKAWMPFRMFRSEHEAELDDARHEAWTAAADIAREALRLAGEDQS